MTLRGQALTVLEALPLRLWIQRTIGCTNCKSNLTYSQSIKAKSFFYASISNNTFTVADVDNKSGESSDVTSEGTSGSKNKKKNQKKSQGGGSQNTVTPPILAEAGRLSPVQLKCFAVGTYQLKQVRSYYCT